MDTTTLDTVSARASLVGMGRIRWKLPGYLRAHGISAYRLATTVDRHTRMPTIYRLAKDTTELSRIDMNVLATVIEGLRELTGEDVQVSDLIEYEEGQS